MEIITLKDLKETVAKQYVVDTTENFVLSELSDYPDSTLIVVLMYNDYGGSLIDKALIRLFKDKYKDNILVKDIEYFGEVGYVYPTTKSQEYLENVVIELIEDSEDYPLGFQDLILEEYFFEVEEELIEEHLQVLYDDLKRNEKYYVVGRKNNWVNKSARCLYGEIVVDMGGVITSESIIIKILVKNKLVIDKEFLD